MNPESIFQYIKEAFTTQPLPEKPVNPSKKEQRSYDERVRQTIIRQKRLDRRRRKIIVVGTGSAVLVAVGGFIGIPLLTQGNSNQQVDNTQRSPFSGEVYETFDYLAKWSNDLREGKTRVENLVPQIIGLSTAYFKNQMVFNFPRRAAEYQAMPLADRISVVNMQGLQDQLASIGCGYNNPAAIRDIIGLTDIIHDRAFMDSERWLTTPEPVTGARYAFASLIHELHHLAAPTRKDPSTSQDPKHPGIPLRRYRKGVMIITRDDKLNTTAAPDCVYESEDNALEETIVQDSAHRMLVKVGNDFRFPSYEGLVKTYRDFVINEFLNGDWLSPLNYHQTTDRDNLFTFYARKFYQDDNVDNPIQKGEEFIHGLFPK